MSIAEKLTTIAENEQKVYEAGKGVIWDDLQANGTRVDYGHAFYRWETATEIVPKYPIKTNNMSSMFGICRKLINLPPIEITSTTVEALNAFGFCDSLKSVDLDMPISGSAGAMFADCYELETIQKLIVTKNTMYYNAAFRNNHSLKNIVFEGVINGDIDFRWSTLLTKDSIISIINALNTSASSLTCTLSKTAINKAFETSEGANDGQYSADWSSLVASRSNWTISLV